MQVGVRVDAHNDLSDIEMHVILGRGCDAIAAMDYVADDGLGYGYQRGARSVHRFTAQRVGDTIHLTILALQTGWKPQRFRVVTYDGATSLEVTMDEKKRNVALSAHQWCFSGAMLEALASKSLEVNGS